jgi:hypothetical protein
MGSKSTDAQKARDVWEKRWGKKIPKGWICHHKNGDPTDNSKDNLIIASLAKHNSMTKRGKTLKQQARQATNKPNIAGAEKPQRRYR